MALDKLVDSAQLDTDLTSVANAIRTKGGTSASLAFPADFVTAIGNIPTGGGGSTDYTYVDTYTVTEAAHAIEIPYGDYDDLLLDFDLTLSGNSQIYCSLSGGGFAGNSGTSVFATSSASSKQGVVQVCHVSGGAYGNATATDFYAGAWVVSNGSSYLRNGDGATKLRVFCYTGSVDMTAGTIKVYGRTNS